MSMTSSIYSAEEKGEITKRFRSISQDILKGRYKRFRGGKRNR